MEHPFNPSGCPSYVSDLLLLAIGSEAIHWPFRQSKRTELDPSQKIREGTESGTHLFTLQTVPLELHAILWWGDWEGHLKREWISSFLVQTNLSHTCKEKIYKIIWIFK